VLTSNSRETAVMTVYARQQLVDFQDIGYGSAASVLIFAVIALIAVAYVLASRKSLEAPS
jgi:trehalose/maltose transport system permease protein